MKINEIYPALNGEGVHVGVPVVIIRMQGCNLVCKYCDTMHAHDLGGGEEMSLDEVFKKVPGSTRRVLITGGEPLMQPDSLLELVRRLHYGRHIEVEVETNGSVEPPRWWREVDCWSADIKCPSSGEEASSNRRWLGTRECDQVKFVVSNDEDLLFARKTFVFPERVNPTILLSPTYPWEQEFLHLCADCCVMWGVRLSLQQHKIIYGERRGV